MVYPARRTAIQIDGDGTMTETHAPKFDELEIAELEGVSGSGGGDKKPGGSKTEAPQEYLIYNMTEVFISS
jgi:hypothetical protein